MATKHTLSALGALFENLQVDHWMDNQGAVKALGGIIPGDPERILGGSSKLKIQKLVMDIGDMCISKNIKLRTFWVPKELAISGPKQGLIL